MTQVILYCTLLGVAFTLILLLAYAVYLIWWKDFCTKAKLIPGTKSWTLPIIGDAYHFVGASDLIGMMDVVKKLVNNEPVMKLWIGPILMIVIADPKLFEILVPHSTTVNKDQLVYGTMKAIFTGVFGLNGEIWQALRKPLVRQLNPRDPLAFHEIWSRMSRRLVRALSSKTDGPPFNIHNHIKLCALDVICEAAMGVEDINETEDNVFNFAVEISRLSEIATKRFFRPHLFFDILFPFTPRGRESMKLERRTSLLCSKVLEKRLALLKTKKAQDNDGEPQFYSDVILKIGRKWGFTHKEMSFLSKDIYLAGTDATSTTMASCLAFLAMFPDHQKKVYDEMLDIFGDSDRDPTLEDLKRMVFLEMCLKEALRHCAPAAITRRLSSDIQIENYHFPKGAMLYFAFYFTHKNPIWWKRPDDFYPEHFTKEAVAERPKGVFMPFSAGARGCPGQTFAWLSMKTITSRLIRSYEFHTKMEFKKSHYHVLLVPQLKEGYFVSITKRSKQAHK